MPTTSACATIRTKASSAGLQEGVFTSSTILVTCPWFEEAAEFARNNPAADLGVHLTLTAEWDSYKWGPVSATACSAVARR